MDRSSNDRQTQDGPSEEDCLREAAQRAAASSAGGGPEGGGRAADASRQRLSHLVQTLESDVIPRLVQAHRPAAPAHPAAPRPATPLDLCAFARQCFAADDGPMLRVVREWRAAGCPVDRVFTDLVGPAARELGRMWEDDLCDFTDVTVGVGRLQQLLRELSPAYGAEVQPPLDGRRILLAPLPGEQHTLGLSMVGEFFRHAGWDVVGGVGAEELDPVDCVQAEWFDVVGLSTGHQRQLDSLRDCIARVRQASRNRGVGVLVGGPLFAHAREYAAVVGADAVVTDGLDAPAIAENLIATRARRL